MTLPAPFAAAEEGLFTTARYWEGVGNSILYSVLGIALMLFAMKVFDWISPKIDMQTELAEKKNTAVAIVVAAVILGVSYVVATAIQ
jgi:putative membrane protein